MDNQRKFIIRPITADDDAAIAAIIRDNLRAAHLDIPGTAYFDPELDHLARSITPSLSVAAIISPPMKMAPSSAVSATQNFLA